MINHFHRTIIAVCNLRSNVQCRHPRDEKSLASRSHTLCSFVVEALTFPPGELRLGHGHAVVAGLVHQAVVVLTVELQTLARALAAAALFAQCEGRVVWESGSEPCHLHTAATDCFCESGLYSSSSFLPKAPEGAHWCHKNRGRALHSVTE